MSDRKFLAAFGALAIVCLTWYGARLPWNSSEHDVIGLEGAPPEILTLPAGQNAEQSFFSKRPRISAISVYADNSAYARQQLSLTVSDTGGRTLASSREPQASYRNEKLKISFSLNHSLQVRPDQELIIRLDHLRGDPLNLFTLTENVYQRGTLRINELPTRQELDLALTISEPTSLSSGQQSGLAAGLITFLGALLIYLLPNRPPVKWWLAAALLLLVTPLATGGFWQNRDLLGINDWDFYFSVHEALRHSLMDLHAFPFWNPYTCGGTAGLGDPEFPVFTPTFLLEIAFGVPLGLRLSIFLSTAIGALGMLALSRRLGLSPLGSLTAALIAFFGSVNLLEVVEGHPNIFSAMWVPWIFWGWLTAYRWEITNWKRWQTKDRLSNRWSLLCGIFLALTFYQGGIYLLFYTAAAFLILIFLVKDKPKAFRVTLKAGLWALGLAALKLIPALLWLSEFQDTAYASSTLTLPYLHEILLSRHLHGAEILPDQGTGWHEYGAHIGPLAIALAILGLSAWRRSRLTRALGLATVLAIVLSSAGPVLEPIFDRLPFIPRSSISRVILFAVIPLALLAGRGLDLLPYWRARASALTPVIVGLLALTLMSLTYPLSQQAFIVPPPAEPQSVSPYPIAFTSNTYQTRIAGIDYTRSYVAALAGFGTLNYCTPLSPSPRVVTIEQNEDSSIISLNHRENGTINLTSWSPNIIVARASLNQQSEVLVNTNYAKGWTVNGEPAKEIGGRVGAILPPGEHELIFKYRSPGFIPGLLITVLTLAVIYFLFVRRKWAKSGH